MTGTKVTKGFADKLQDLIKECGKEIRVIAKESGVAAGSISKYQNDDGEAGINNITKLADYFDVSVDWLLGRSIYKNKKTEFIKVSDLGLSETAVEVLQGINASDKYRGNGKRISPKLMSILSTVLANDRHLLLMFLDRMWNSIDLNVNKISISEEKDWAQDIDYEQFLEDGYVLLSIEQGSRYAFLDAQTHMTKLVEEAYSSLIKSYKNGGGEDGEHPQD